MRNCEPEDLKQGDVTTGVGESTKY